MSDSDRARIAAMDALAQRITHVIEHSPMPIAIGAVAATLGTLLPQAYGDAPEAKDLRAMLVEVIAGCMAGCPFPERES